MKQYCEQYADAIKRYERLHMETEAARRALEPYEAEIKTLKKKHDYARKSRQISNASSKERTAMTLIENTACAYIIDEICKAFQARHYASLKTEKKPFPDAELTKWLQKNGVRVTGQQCGFGLDALNIEIQEYIETPKDLQDLDTHVHIRLDPLGQVYKLGYTWLDPDRHDPIDSSVSVCIRKDIVMDVQAFIDKLTAKANAESEPEQSRTVLEQLPPDIRNNPDALRDLYAELTKELADET